MSTISTRRPQQGEAAGPVRLTLVGFVLLVTLTLAVFASLMIGAYSARPDAVISALVGTGSAELQGVLLSLRLPRTVLAVLTGAALAAAGVLMQGLTRNPLADPGILGVNAGAGLAVAIAVGALGITAASTMMIAATIGAFAATVIVYAIGASARDRWTPLG